MGTESLTRWQLLLRRTRWGVISALIGLPLSAWIVGWLLMAPRQQSVGDAPRALPFEDVSFLSDNGATVHGWYCAREPDAAAVLLLHGLHGCRLAMLSRVGMLVDAGYAVLLIDHAGHGESIADHVTFGWQEAGDVTAAVRYLREGRQHTQVAAIGESMGGVAILMAKRPVRLDAVVLELVYASFEQAVDDRVSRWLGSWGSAVITPMLTCQCQMRLGFEAEDLAPVDHIADLGAPVLILGGACDEHTPVRETQRLFDAAVEPKSMWIVPAAIHASLKSQAPEAYAERVLAFLAANL